MLYNESKLLHILLTINGGGIPVYNCKSIDSILSQLFGREIIDSNYSKKYSPIFPLLWMETKIFSVFFSLAKEFRVLIMFIIIILETED